MADNPIPDGATDGTARMALAWEIAHDAFRRLPSNKTGDLSGAAFVALQTDLFRQAWHELFEAPKK